MEFLGISFWEFLLILVVIIVVLGPSRIPGIMRNLGNIVRNIRKASSELTTSISREIEADNAERKRTPPPVPPPSGPEKESPPRQPPEQRSTHHEQ